MIKTFKDLVIGEQFIFQNDIGNVIWYKTDVVQLNCCTKRNVLVVSDSSRYCWVDDNTVVNIPQG